MYTAKIPPKACYRAAAAACVATAWSLPALGFDLGDGLQAEGNRRFRVDLHFLTSAPASSHPAGAEPDASEAAEAPVAAQRRQEAGSRDHGDWGIAARYRSERLRTDFDLYWMNYHPRLAEIYTETGVDYLSKQVPYRSTGDSGPVSQQATRLLGASFATTLNKTSLGGGVEVYQNTPVSNLPPSQWQDNAGGDRNKQSLYAMGSAVQTRLSATYVLAPTALWDSASVLLSVGKLRRSATTPNAGPSDTGFSSQTRGVQLLFTPVWQQALSNLDISLPMSIGYGTKSQAPLPGAPGTYKGGRFAIGVAAVYQKVWNMDLRYTHFFQGDTSDLALKDRNFVWLTVQRSF